MTRQEIIAHLETLRNIHRSLDGNTITDKLKVAIDALEDLREDRSVPWRPGQSILAHGDVLVSARAVAEAGCRIIIEPARPEIDS